jgi:hypothetical protein
LCCWSMLRLWAGLPFSSLDWSGKAVNDKNTWLKLHIIYSHEVVHDVVSSRCKTLFEPKVSGWSHAIPPRRSHNMHAGWVICDESEVYNRDAHGIHDVGNAMTACTLFFWRSRHSPSSTHCERQENPAAGPNGTLGLSLLRWLPFWWPHSLKNSLSLSAMTRCRAQGSMDHMQWAGRVLGK